MPSDEPSMEKYWPMADVSCGGMRWKWKWKCLLRGRDFPLMLGPAPYLGHAVRGQVVRQVGNETEDGYEEYKTVGIPMSRGAQLEFRASQRAYKGRRVVTRRDEMSRNKTKRNETKLKETKQTGRTEHFRLLLGQGPGGLSIGLCT